jgi:hypothetical protein
MNILKAGLALAVVAGLVATGEAQQQPKKKKVVLPADSLYNVAAKNLEGQAVDLKDFAGQVALVVNLASQ